MHTAIPNDLKSNPLSHHIVLHKSEPPAEPNDAELLLAAHHPMLGVPTQPPLRESNTSAIYLHASKANRLIQMEANIELQQNAN